MSLLHPFLLLLLAIWAPTLAKDPHTFNLRDANHPDAIAATELDLLRRYPSDNDNKPDSNEYFRLLELDGEHLLIGAADAVHNVSLRSFERANIYRWAPGEAEHAECTMKSMDQNLCRNFVRVLSRLSSGRLLICGTNAFAPACRLLSARGDTIREFPAVGMAPFDPAQNSTYLLAQGDLLYSATVADFAGTDALIFRKNVSDPGEGGGLRTQRGNPLMLDRPQFVGTLQTEEHVYFFFHERAAEAAAEFQPGSYSRVARVCKRDPGGARPHYAAEWSSFVKARLNCSVPERNRPFYFDELLAVSNPVGDDLVYATFVSEFNFLRHSVICVFRLSQIDALFRRGQHLAYDAAQRRWTRRERDELTAGLGQCPQSGQRTMSEDEAIAMRKYPLMADTVPNSFPGGAAGIHRGADHYNQIAVLPGVLPMDSAVAGDVLYVATDQGNLLKLFNPLALSSSSSSNSSSASAPSPSDPLRPIALFHLSPHPIRRLLISPSSQLLVAVTDHRVFRLRLHACELYPSCARCVGARDPHCVWHEKRCRSWTEVKAEGWLPGQEPVQDVFGRKGAEHELCRGKEIEAETPRKVDGPVAEDAAKAAGNKKCECPEGRNNRHQCECPDAVAEEELRTTEVAETTSGTEVVVGKGLPWWVLALVALALLQTLAFLWLCCRLCARRRRLRRNSAAVAGCKLPFGGTATDATSASLSPRSLLSASGGLISAYSPASFTLAAQHPQLSLGNNHNISSSTTSGHWTLTSDGSGSNRSSAASAKEPIGDDARGSPVYACGLRRTASIGGGGDISVKLEGCATGTLPLPSSLYHHHNYHYFNPATLPPAMSTFRR